MKSELDIVKRVNVLCDEIKALHARLNDPAPADQTQARRTALRRELAGKEGQVSALQWVLVDGAA